MVLTSPPLSLRCRRYCGFVDAGLELGKFAAAEVVEAIIISSFQFIILNLPNTELILSKFCY